MSNIKEITDERQATYGPPQEHFARTVAILNTLGFRRYGRELDITDWPQIMIADKLARACNSPHFKDHRKDVQGYAWAWGMVEGDTE
jgi:hypothetical protein